SVNGKKNDGKAKESLQVVDVAQLLLDSVRTPSAEAAETEETEAGEAKSEGAPAASDSDRVAGGPAPVK
ncbi:hypothetical protein, partial [Streptomyces sp. NPDC055287]